MLAAEEAQIIPFLPSVLNQLFRLLASKKSSKDIKSNCVKSLVHIVKVCHSDQKEDLLAQYIKVCVIELLYFAFNTMVVFSISLSRNHGVMPQVQPFMKSWLQA